MYISRLLASIGLLAPQHNNGAQWPESAISPQYHLGSDQNTIHELFGGAAAWNNSRVSWVAVDDRVRGGSSQSYLDVLADNNAAVFYGTLDTKTLGGAGFASQSTRPATSATSSGARDDDGYDADNDDCGDYDADLLWDLSTYDGIALWLGKGDDKTYTLTLKDELPPTKRPDGRERSGISWEAKFVAKPATQEQDEQAVVWLPWDVFRASYRGREKKDAGPLKTAQLRRFGLMMRSFFDTQDGDFRLEIIRIAAVKMHSAGKEVGSEL